MVSHGKFKGIMAALIIALAVTGALVLPLIVVHTESVHANRQLDVATKILTELRAAISAGPAAQRDAILKNLQATACMLSILPEERTQENLERCVTEAFGP